MGKIRINELARELEVKPNRLLELLPEFGVTDKRTHSSSVDDEVADALRRHFGLLPAEPQEEPAPAAAPPVEAAPAEGLEPEVPAGPVQGPPSQVAAPPAPPEIREQPAAETGVPAEGFLAARGAPQKLRPPLAGAKPAVEPPPPPPAAAPPARPAAVPAKPVPAAPKPGQILSGPRQPLPATLVETPPATPIAARVPQAVAPPPPAVPAAPRPHARATLAGQPAARPVVPPRPDLVARLTQPRAVPGQPQPRVARPASAPIPGQPIYRGPIRPGQTIRPAGPAARIARGKTTHPTSAGRMEAPAVAPVEQRRPGGRRPVGAAGRERQVDREERTLRPAFR
ncbi:MAG TPA: translation initiation factor IF-2 N-terminal domain-containing protein, partial [Bryobacteraceae bacterium]|nr:translation initiation factor IF-2 N-terminal domain-containing protein [Bryobacteraceae bacterium]